MLTHLSIVLLGAFNPAIFHPEWLERFGIIPAQDAEWAEGERAIVEEVKFGEHRLIKKGGGSLLVSPEFAIIDFPGIRLTIDRERFQCLTDQRKRFKDVKMITQKSFECLSHTPIKAGGINIDSHILLNESSEEKLKQLFSGNEPLITKIFGEKYQIGGKLVYWDQQVKRIIEIEPSDLMPLGIHIHANFHIDFVTKEASEAVGWISAYFEKSIDDLSQLINQLFGSIKEIWQPSIQPK